VELHRDRERCQGHGRCYSPAPRIFTSDDDGFAVLVNEDLTADEEAEARIAVNSCPERAISLA
jgi:ferredoxin